MGYIKKNLSWFLRTHTEVCGMRTRCVRQHKNGLRGAAAAATAVLRADCAAAAAAPQSLKHSFTLVCVKQIFFYFSMLAQFFFRQIFHVLLEQKKMQ